MILIDITYDATIAAEWLKAIFIPAIRNAASECMKELLAETTVNCLQISDKLKPNLPKNLRVSLSIRLTRGACVVFRGDMDDCVIAKRLIATLSHGNDLMPYSAIFLRDHAGVCPGCRSEWEGVRALVR